MPFLGPKWPICPEQNFLGTNHYYFYLPIGPFHCLKCKENSYSRSRVMRMHHFWARNGPFAPNKIFFGNHLSINFHLSISSFYCVKFKNNSSSGSRVMRMLNFWAQNCPFAQMRIFSENLLMSLVPFIHAYLHDKQSHILIY